jgi:hypothetical protein
LFIYPDRSVELGPEQKTAVMSAACLAMVP